MANVEINLQLFIDKANRNLKVIDASARRTNDSFEDLNRSAKGVEKTLGNIGQIGAGVALGGVLLRSVELLRDTMFLAIQGFASFESALVGVGKTADITGDELTKFGEDIRKLDIAAANDELLELAKTAGQLGIQGTSNLLKFTEVMAKLRSATDVAGEEGASSIARILNVTNTSIKSIDRFGAALVELGNTSAATESEILDVATRVAQAAAIYDISAEETLAFGAALKSLGVDAAVGGSSIGRALKQIDTAISKGGKTLTEFADVLDLTEKQLVQNFTEDKVGTLLLFLESLNRSGANANQVLNQLGLTDIRVSTTLSILAKNIDLVNTSLESSRDAFRENKALNEEYERTLETLDSKWIELKKSASSLGIEVVDTLAPAIKLALDLTKDFIDLLQVRPFDPELDISQMNLSQLKERYAEVETEIDNINAAILRVNQQKDIIPEQKIQATLKYNQELQQLNTTFDAVASQIEKLSALQDQQDVALLGDKEQIRADGEAIIAISEELQKRILEAKQKRSQAEAALRLFDSEQENVFLDERLVKLEEFFSRERASLLQAQLDATTIEAEKQALLNEIISEGLRNQLKLKQTAADKEAKLEATKSKAIVEQTGNLFGSLSALAASGGKELFETSKAFATAEATIKGYQAIQNALAQVPYPANIIAAASIGIRTAANISRINSTQAPGFEDGGFVGGQSFSGDNVPIRVNSGEAVLNARQQRNFMNLANGQQGGQRVFEIRNVIMLDGQQISESVSRQVADGMELGEFI